MSGRTDPTPSPGVASGMSSTTPAETPVETPVAPLTPGGYAFRRFLRVWIGVAAIELLLYLFLYRSPELKGLYKLPAIAVLVAGLIQGWHARRRRHGGDRRRADRRREGEND